MADYEELLKRYGNDYLESTNCFDDMYICYSCDTKEEMMNPNY